MKGKAKKKLYKKKSDFREARGKVNDYGSDPFFVKKAEESKIFLDENGFPKDALKG